MTRELRPRNSRPSYLAMAGYVSEDEGGGNTEVGPSAAVFTFENEGDSGSDFAPEKEVAANPDEDDDIPLDPALGSDSEKLDPEPGEDGMQIDDEPIAFSVTRVPGQGAASKKRKGKAKIRESGAKTVAGMAPGLSRTSTRQMYILPTPSVHHRHRAIPLYTYSGLVERLTSYPALFGPPEIALTNNFTQNPGVTERVNKAWGYNVGSGPLWQLVEDRGWWKEAIIGDSEKEKESNRRPRVYGDLSVLPDWQILNIEDASLYLPSDTVTTEEGNLKPPPPVPCSFGPIDGQTRVEVKMFESHNMSEFFPESTAHVFNAGAPVWGLDWCPIHFNERPDRAYLQYLAVAPSPSRLHSPDIGVRVARPSFACVQIWTLSPTQPIGSKESDEDMGKMKCEMVLCLDCGPAHDLKWCPLPSHDQVLDLTREKPRKLGILAGTFEDGSMSIYAVPDPKDVTPPGHDPSLPVFVKLPEPLLRIELEETVCWSLDWANSETMAIGTTNGIIAVYNIAEALREGKGTSPVPTHYLTVHQSAIRAITWIRVPPCWPSGLPRLDADPTVIASGGYDGVECLTDIREGHSSVMNRTRDVINAMAFSQFAGGPVTIDHENIVKAYSVSPSMLGRGHLLLEPGGPVWSLGTSDYHSQLAIGCADGSCTTTNVLRSTRRGGLVPFFVHKVFQVDFSRQSGEYRMLEHFLPQETQDRPSANRTAKQSKAKNEPVKLAAPSTGVWPSEVGVHRVVWNQGNGLAGSGLLASATATGLCRVDLLYGRWLKNKVSYGSVEEIRREGAADDDVIDSPAE